MDVDEATRGINEIAKGRDLWRYTDDGLLMYQDETAALRRTGDLMEALVSFQGASSEERRRMNSRLTLDGADRLNFFARFLAIDAVKLHDPKLLLYGLLAMSAAAGKLDLRDALPTMSMLRHSAKKLGVDPDPLFRLADDLDATDVKWLGRYQALPEAKRELYGWEEVMTKDGFAYRRR